MASTASKPFAGEVTEPGKHMASFESIYKDIHEHPELSKQESRTAALAARHLEQEGYEVYEGIGGHSAVGVLRNGPGRNVLLRADMDALPMLEETDLPYASKTRSVDIHDGSEKPVMHACGHDMHTTCLMAAATILAARKADWTGTLICLFQPDEEVGAGARDMIAAGLYKKIGVQPDLLLGQHVFPLRAGVLALRSGPIFSACDNFAIRVYGKGGHASRPDVCVDPILLAAHILVRVQSVVSREVPPLSTAVVTCGKFQGGTADNIIPDFCDFTFSIRTYELSVREKVLASVMRIIRLECEIAGSPRNPDIQRTDEAPPVINDEALTSQLHTSFIGTFGSTDVEVMTPTLASEDFANLADGDIPYVFWLLGCVDEHTWNIAKADDRLDDLPGLHTSKFAPTISVTLERGTDALVTAALTFLR